MGRSLFAISVLAAFLSAASCRSAEDYRREADTLRRSIPDDYRRTGMVSSSTYQVHFRVSGRNEAEAAEAAKAECEPLALKYLLKEPFIFVYVSQFGVQRLKEIIHKKGSIIVLQKSEQNQDYDVVYHVTDYGLREQFQQIR